MERHGPDGITHLRVAEEAGVARATVYRHWPGRLDLVVDVLQSGATLPALQIDESASIRDQVKSVMHRLAGALNGDMAGALPMLLGLAESDEKIREAKQALMAAGPGRIVAMLASAIARGEIEGDDPELLTQQLLGPLLVRRVMFDRSLTEHDVERIADTVLGPDPQA